MKRFRELGLLLLIALLCFSTGAPYRGPKMMYDVGLNSMNFGLIGLNNDYLILNKVNDVTAYDFNSNQVKILATYDRYSYRNLIIQDSFLLLSGSRIGFYKVLDNGLSPMHQNVGGELENANEFRNADSILIVLCNRFFGKANAYTYDSKRRSLVISKLNKKTSSVKKMDVFDPLVKETTSFVIMEDSLLVFMNDKISKLNLLDASPVASVVDLNFNPENNITTTVAFNNHICTSNSKIIYFLDLVNGNIKLKGEMR